MISTQTNTLHRVSKVETVTTGDTMQRIEQEKKVCSLAKAQFERNSDVKAEQTSTAACTVIHHNEGVWATHCLSTWKEGVFTSFQNFCTLPFFYC